MRFVFVGRINGYGRLNLMITTGENGFVDGRRLPKEQINNCNPPNDEKSDF